MVINHQNTVYIIFTGCRLGACAFLNKNLNSMRQRIEVALNDIEHISRSELSASKLHALENSYDSFDYQLRQSSDPIALSKGSKPYSIINGRHRVYLARQKGMHTVPVIFI